MTNYNMNIDVSTTNYQILQSGSVIVPLNEYVEFKIEDLIFRFTFENNVKEEGKLKAMSLDIKPSPNKKCMYINLINMKGAINATNTEILDMATIQGKKLYMKFSISSINHQDEGCDFLFNYTWYLSK